MSSAASHLVLTLFLLYSVQCILGDTETYLDFYAKLFEIGEKIERSPTLKAEWNERVRKDQQAVDIPPAQFTCDTSFGRSPTRPTSVHAIRPGDIDVVAAFGDSISAGNGLGALTLLEVAIENREEVFSIGGKATLEEGVITLPNIMRKFNPNLKGYSLCRSTENNEMKSWFNVARPGGTCDDMFTEAQMLIQRMKDDPRIDYQNDWKLLTMFVGGNDLCASCRRNYSAEAYYAWFEKALIEIKAQMPRTIINLVSMFDITPLEGFSTGLVCDLLQWGFCDCARNSTSKLTLTPLKNAYDDVFVQLSGDPRFKADDFTVIRQPHMRDMEPPIDPETGEYMEGFLSPDCFHPSRVAHQGFATYLWNTMLIPVGDKPVWFNSSDFDIPINCPTEDAPFIFTDENSVGHASNSPTTTTSTTAAPTAAPSSTTTMTTTTESTTTTTPTPAITEAATVGLP